MSAKRLHVRVISPDRVVFEGEAASLQFPGGDGLYGILPRHAPLITTVEPGVLRLVDDRGEETRLAIARGFVSVKDDRIEFAVDAGEPAEEIDVERARAAAERARERMRGKVHTSEVEDMRTEYALRRAIARLRAAGKYHEHHGSSAAH